MANTHIQPGMVLGLTAPVGGVVINQGYLVGSFFAIAANGPVDEGDQFQGQVGPGVFDMVKKAGETWADGDDIYWDDAAKEASNVAGDMLIGAAQIAADTAATGPVKLNGVSSQSAAAPPASASIFVSAQTAATGAAQLIAHPLGVVPSSVTVQIESGHDGAAGVGDLTPGVNSDGTHTITDVEVTVTAGALFKVTAYV